MRMVLPMEMKRTRVRKIERRRIRVWNILVCLSIVVRQTFIDIITYSFMIDYVRCLQSRLHFYEGEEDDDDEI